MRETPPRLEARGGGRGGGRGALPTERVTEVVLFFNDTGDGIDLAPDRIYFLTAEGWFLSKRGFPAADDVIIPPGKIFVIRHPVGEAATDFFPNQVVAEGKHAAPLRTRMTGPQDNQEVRLGDAAVGSLGVPAGR